MSHIIGSEYVEASRLVSSVAGGWSRKSHDWSRGMRPQLLLTNIETKIDWKVITIFTIRQLILDQLQCVPAEDIIYRSI